MKYVFEDFNIENNNSKVMFSAPHSFPQLRNGQIKSAETKTGFLVEALSKCFNCSCIYKTKFYNNDPNWDEKSTYKEQLVDFISENNVKCLFDIHSMYYERPIDICIGTNFGKNILNRYDFLDMMVNSFKSVSFSTVLVDNPFSASNPYTVSAYVADKCMIPCFQIEINNKFLPSDCELPSSDLLYKSFEKILNNIDFLSL